jgi:hypothetical protein
VVMVVLVVLVLVAVVVKTHCDFHFSASKSR